MARHPLTRRDPALIFIIFRIHMIKLSIILALYTLIDLLINETDGRGHGGGGHTPFPETRHKIRSFNLNKMVFESDIAAVANVRMDRRAFHKLCHLLVTEGGLTDTKHMTIEELVATFLHIIGHDVKNRVMYRQTSRSGETISRQFRRVLACVLRLHKILLKSPEPIQEGSTDGRWKWFTVSMTNSSVFLFIYLENFTIT
jgi:hypothetical protein